MATILSVAEVSPPHIILQKEAAEFARKMFEPAFKNINRLLEVFKNGQIEKRHFIKDLDWYKEKRSFSEKNDCFIESAVDLGAKAIQDCLENPEYLKNKVRYEEIDAIITICTTGLATPSIEARIMNKLPFSPHTKRIPIWGLGCAGGVSGLSRAYEYCLANPKAMVLVLSIELCSLTFQYDDLSKSNLIGTSLFADGIACTLVAGHDVKADKYSKKQAVPKVIDVQSTLMQDSLDVMGWDVKDEGLYVVFSKDIPSIVKKWLRPNVDHFLSQHGMAIGQINQFIAHPGGKKVLEAYGEALSLSNEKLAPSFEVLKEYGNMSSVTIFYVLNRIMRKVESANQWGLAVALGPGFSSELLLVRWEQL
ncbi:MAG TPA: 3-oxoacyl-[acyl-carrier-protein] synthase III C-terminal domain-containing protein [Bacillus sp. (in: firmicutes)]|uniref:type III polyketide synthase n=1 Tax=Bacillus litorisediminis TaxID=2922713 RepID=UPI001FABA9DC|nr:3-oxoacyl-[acyl-carrier-protein] synthase III C-terminal domain-containing protein [Bacillus litorisediminis]HWO76342.1 3-oxoacyl-[acyl-carrier-protein] synthase III C-terminal domain-containing protein [Bacillus sp. (in: firmicutes)]